MNLPRPFSLQLPLGAFLLALLLLGSASLAQDPGQAEHKINLSLQGRRQDKLRESDPFAQQVKDLSWQFRIGTFAADPALKLYSFAREFLEDGLEQLDARLPQLQKKEAELSKALAELTDPQQRDEFLRSNFGLLRRLELIRKLRLQAVKQKDLTRAKERERLGQLRSLASTYRDLTAKMASMNTYFLLGDHANLNKVNQEVTTQLAQIEKIAQSPVDYYLFHDEPKLDAEQVKLLTEVTPPVIHSLVTHFRSLQWFMTHQLALDPRLKKTSAQRASELTKLVQEIKEELKDPLKASVLSYYVHGVSEHELGLLQTEAQSLDPVAHAAASKHFQLARESFDKARRQGASEKLLLDRLDDDLNQRQQELASTHLFFVRADRHLRDGRPDLAALALERGLRMHRDSKLLTARANALIRAGSDLQAVRDELKRFPDLDSEGRLTQGRVELFHTWEQYARLPSVPPAQRRAFLTQFSEARSRFNQAAREPADARLKQLAAAYSALTYAYATHLDPEADLKDSTLAFQGLKTLLEQLGQQVETAQTQQKQASQNADPEAARKAYESLLQAREALVAARLAQGFLGLRFLPAYREEPMLAFQAAADEQARLGFLRTSSKLFGSPVLAAMLSRPDMKGLKVAAEERQLRELVGRVAEGLAALQLGAPEAASRQIKASLQEIDKLSGEPPVDAATLLDQREENAREALRTRSRALAVMTLVDGGQSEVALLEALKLSRVKLSVSTSADLSVKDLRLASSGITDPLASYALGLATEEFAVSRLDPTSDRAQELLREATRIQQETKRRLETSRPLLQRYPQVQSLTEAALDRLTRPEIYLNQAKQKRQDALIAEAARVVEDGLKRHPREERLQEEFLLTKLDEAELPSRGSESLRQIVQLAEQASKQGKLKDARGLIVLGEAQERLGRYDEALLSYQRALDAKPPMPQRLKATVRISVLRARLEGDREPGTTK